MQKICEYIWQEYILQWGVIKSRRGLEGGSLCSRGGGHPERKRRQILGSKIWQKIPSASANAQPMPQFATRSTGDDQVKPQAGLQVAFHGVVQNDERRTLATTDRIQLYRITELEPDGGIDHGGMIRWNFNFTIKKVVQIDNAGGDIENCSPSTGPTLRNGCRHLVSCHVSDIHPSY